MSNMYIWCPHHRCYPIVIPMLLRFYCMTLCWPIMSINVFFSSISTCWNLSNKLLFKLWFLDYFNCYSRWCLYVYKLDHEFAKYLIIMFYVFQVRISYKKYWLHFKPSLIISSGLYLKKNVSVKQDACHKGSNLRNSYKQTIGSSSSFVLNHPLQRDFDLRHKNYIRNQARFFFDWRKDPGISRYYNLIKIEM